MVLVIVWAGDIGNRYCKIDGSKFADGFSIRILLQEDRDAVGERYELPMECIRSTWIQRRWAAYWLLF